MPLIDFHTHHHTHDASNIVTITSLDYSEYHNQDLSQDLSVSGPLSFYSIGLHPWFLEPNLQQHNQSTNLLHAQNINALEQLMQNLWQIAQNERVIAIGECGLDRHYGSKNPSTLHWNSPDSLATTIDLPLQMLAFSAQIELSETLQKPLIIHCVKAFNELINLKQKHRPRMPWLVHGFDKKDDLRRSLAQHGIKVSFGASICQPKGLIQSVIAAVPLEQLFLETDAQTKFTIKEIYQRAALIKQVAVEQLQEQLWQNFTSLFNYG